MAAITGTGTGLYIGVVAPQIEGAKNIDTSTGAHRYWRIYFDATNKVGDNYYRLNSLQMFDVNDLVYPVNDYFDYETGAAGAQTDIYSTNSNNGSPTYPNYYLFDEYDGSGFPQWYSQFQEGNTEIWIQTEFVTAKDIRKYYIINGGWESGEFDSAPSAFRLAYSDDGVSWYIRHTGTAVWPANGTEADSNTWTANFPDSRFVKGGFTDDRVYLWAPQTDISVLTGDGLLASSPPDYSRTYNGEASFRELFQDPPLNLGYALDENGGSLSKPTGTGEVFPNTFLVGSAEIPDLTGTGQGFTPNFANGVGRLAYLSATAGTFDPAEDGLIPLLTGAGNLYSGMVSTGVGTLELLTGNGSLDTARMEPLTGTGESEVGNVLNGDVRLNRLTGNGSADLASMNPLTGTGEAESGYVLNGIGTLAKLTAIGSANDTQSLEALTATGVMSTGIVGVGLGVIKRLTAAGSANDTPSLLPLTGSGTALPSSVSIGLNTLEQLSITGVIDNPQASSLQGAASMELLTGTALTVGGNIYNGSALLQKLTLAATGITGRITTGSITLPLLTGTGIVSSDVSATLIVELPVLQVSGAINAALEAPSGNALVMNLKNKALTTYDSYGYNSFAEFNGVTLAASPSGLFALSGATDNGAIISASIRLGKLDFDIQQLKTVDIIYAGYTSTDDLLLTVKADDGTEYNYTLEAREAGRHSSRVKLGKGIRGRYLQFGVDNVNGADFRLDTLEMVERVLGRKVR